MEDLDGRPIGRVVATAPLDGSGEPEMALVRMGGGFGRQRWVPLDGAAWMPGRLRVPIPRTVIEDAPAAEDHRWGDPTDVARAHWLLAVE